MGPGWVEGGRSDGAEAETARQGRLALQIEENDALHGLGQVLAGSVRAIGRQRQALPPRATIDLPEEELCTAKLKRLRLRLFAVPG